MGVGVVELCLSDCGVGVLVWCFVCGCVCRGREYSCIAPQWLQKSEPPFPALRSVSQATAQATDEGAVRGGLVRCQC